MTGTNDKLRGLFLAMLMVTSVFAGTIAFAGTAAAANEDPSVTDVVESNGILRVSFSDQVKNSTSSDSLDSQNLQFELYIRQPGESDFQRYGVSDGAVGQVSGAGEYQIAESVHGLGDLSPAAEVKVYVNEIRPESRTTDENDVTPGNVTAQLTSEFLAESSDDHNTVRTAERIYQGSPIVFGAITDTNTDVPILLENVETGEILLDGSTGENSNQIAFDSDNLESGTTYRLTFNENGQHPDYDTETQKYFNVTSLRLSASLDVDGTQFDHDESQDITVEGDAIRGNEDVAIEVRDSDGNLDAVFSDRLNNRAQFEFSTEGLGLEAGDYTVTVIDTPTGVDVEAGTFSVAEFPEADSASFGTGVIQEERGDVATIPIRLQNSEPGAQAHVAIGSLGDTNYVTNVTVNDENGDGEITLEFNSFMAGTENMSAIFNAVGNDTVSSWRGENGSFVSDLRDEANINEFNNNLSRAKLATLDAASYDLRVRAADEGFNRTNFNFTTTDAEGVGTLQLNTRATESSTVYRVPAEKADSVDLDFIQANLDSSADAVDGNLTQTDRVTNREMIVHQISASGIEGVIANQTNWGANETMAFLNEMDMAETDYGPSRNTFDTGFDQVNPPPNAPERAFEIESTHDFTFVPDYENDTYYVAVDLREVDQSKLQFGDLWNASFMLENYDAIGPVLGGSGGGTVYSEWTYVEANAELQTSDGRILIQAQDNQSIMGSTNVAPGTALELRVRSQSDTSPFLETVDARAGSDGAVEFTHDFSNRAAGVNFTAIVRRSGTAISDEYNGRLVADPQASVTFEDQSVSEGGTQAVTVQTVTMNHGGFVAIHEGGADGEIIGTSSYLNAGTSNNVRIALNSTLSEETTLVAMPHLDTNGNNVFDFEGGNVDAAYAMNGSVVTASATISVNVDTTVPPETTTEPPETTTEPPETTTEPPETTTEPPTTEPPTPSPTTTTTGPGFGVIVSVLALLAAALLAARRRD